MTRSFTDMMGRVVEVGFPPKRIVSVVPSQTELLSDLGLDREVAGITKFCVHPPEWFRNKTRVGGTKQLNIDRIKALEPDLIIANKEENEREQIETLAGAFPVWVSDIKTVDQGLEMIRSIGSLVDREIAANSLASDIARGFAALQKASAPLRVAYFIWYRPWMSVGGGTFIGDMIRSVGWVNVLEDQLRYPEVDPGTLRACDPDLVLLSSEPYPFREKHIAEIKAIVPRATVKLVDGEMFSWYGSRMLRAIPYLSGLLTEQ